jgi:hypothetical protein
MTEASRTARSAPARIVQARQFDVEEARTSYLHAATLNAEADLDLHRRFHEAVLGYYFALRRLRERDQVRRKWRTAKALRPALARPAHPRGVTDAEARELRGEDDTRRAVRVGDQYVDLDRLRRTRRDDEGHEWLVGLDHLAEYANKKGECWIQEPGPNEQALARTVAPVLIGADDLLRVSGTLDDIAEALGISAVESPGKNRPKGRIGNDDE